MHSQYKTMSGVPRSRIPAWNLHSQPGFPHHAISRPAWHRPQAGLWSPLVDTMLPRNRLGLGEVTRAHQRGRGGQRSRGTPSAACRKQAPPVFRGLRGHGAITTPDPARGRAQKHTHTHTRWETGASMQTGARAACLISKSCLTFRDPMDFSSAGSSVHGILQAGILECVAMPSSRGSSQPRD